MSPLFPTQSPGERLLIAGPCAAESPGLLLETARQLQAEVGLKYFRAGAWKPRTAPGGFEGFGEKALSWLCEIRSETGLRVGTEVGTATQARLALDYGMDFLWIGARTTGSPFAVEEIAGVLSGQDLPVLVKNPLAPDIDLWTGAIRRLLDHGISRVGAILRGFYVGGASVLRNLPFWHLATEFRKKAPRGLPLLCDPSHIAGHTRFIPSVLREAAGRGLDGFVIESHSDPAQALTDRDQQLKPSELAAILRNLPQGSDDGDASSGELARLRLLLDKIDEELITLLRERFAMTEEIGEWKACHRLPPHQIEREKVLYATRREMAHTYNLSEEMTEKIFRLIHAESLARQERREGKPGKN